MTTRIEWNEPAWRSRGYPTFAEACEAAVVQSATDRSTIELVDEKGRRYTVIAATLETTHLRPGR